MAFTALSATRLALATLLLGSSAIGAQAGWFDFGSSKKDPAKQEKPAAAAATPAGPGTNLEDSVRQAQMLRLAGNYPEAIKHLSQVMMVASDDPRVVSEYGKTLAAMGRAQDAINFLSRAAQLEPGDWTVYSALGVAYDQIGNQKEAQSSYEHALALKPGEPSVLSNYALSRLLAHDPAMAKALAARAEIGNAVAKDAKIAANIAMIRSMAPDPESSFAVNTPAPKPMASVPMPAPRVPVAANPMPAPFVSQAGNAPRPLPQPSNIGPANAGVINAAPQMAQNTPSGVVMQRVPVDPMAGPVKDRAIAAKAPVAKKTAKNVIKSGEKKDDALDMSTARSESPKPAAVPVPGVKSAAAQAEDLQAKAEAMAKQLTNKPAAIAAAQVQANKPVAAAPATPHVLADKAPAAPVKAAEAKPTPHVLPEKAAPSKTAAAPAPKVLPPAPAKSTAKAKDTIPGLRLSANAY